MTFEVALEEWRDQGGVIQVVGPDYTTWIVREVIEGENWRETCEYALAHSDLTEEEIEAEMKELG